MLAAGPAFASRLKPDGAQLSSPDADLATLTVSEEFSHAVPNGSEKVQFLE